MPAWWPQSGSPPPGPPAAPRRSGPGTRSFCMGLGAGRRRSAGRVCVPCGSRSPWREARGKRLSERPRRALRGRHLDATAWLGRSTRSATLLPSCAAHSGPLRSSFLALPLPSRGGGQMRPWSRVPGLRAPVDLWAMGVRPMWPVVCCQAAWPLCVLLYTSSPRSPPGLRFSPCSHDDLCDGGTRDRDPVGSRGIAK